MLTECLVPPPPAVLRAGLLLQNAVVLHLAGDQEGAGKAIVDADMSACSDWADSLWGKGGPWTRPRLPGQPPKSPGIGPRDAPRALEDEIVARDGCWCRFCGIGVVRREVRKAMAVAYPVALRWGDKNNGKHAGFQALTGCFDHLLPYTRGGATSLDNMVLTCWPCNNGRSALTLAEVDLLDPRGRPPRPRHGWEQWNGLSAFR